MEAILIRTNKINDSKYIFIVWGKINKLIKLLVKTKMVIKIASGSNLEYSITDLYISLNLA